MDIEIVQPNEGSVTFTLPYDEAEVLLRLVGQANSGSLLRCAPVLHGLVTGPLVEEFGRSIESEARKYEAERHTSGQVYIHPVDS